MLKAYCSIALTFILIFLIKGAYAQDTTKHSPRFITVEARLGLYRNQQFQKSYSLGTDQGIYDINYGTCRLTGIELVFPANGKMSIYTGASWKFMNVVSRLTIPKGNIWIKQYKFDEVSRYRDNYWTLPLGLTIPLFSHQRLQLQAKAGLALNYREWGREGSWMVINTQKVDSIFRSQINTNIHDDWNVSAELGLSGLYLFPNKSFLKLSLEGSYSPKKTAEGQIIVYEHNKPVSVEHLKANQNAFGVVVSYGVNIDKKLLQLFVSENPIHKTFKNRSFAFQVGFNNSVVRGKELDGDRTGYAGTEIYGGFSYRTRIDSLWDLESGLLFSWTDVFPFLEVPIHLKYKLDNKLMLLLGPKLDISMKNPEQYFSLPKAMVKLSNYDNCGVAFDFGFQYRLSNLFFTECYISRGITKMYEDPLLDIHQGRRNALRLGFGILI